VTLLLKTHDLLEIGFALSFWFSSPTSFGDQISRLCYHHEAIDDPSLAFSRRFPGKPLNSKGIFPAYNEKCSF
jgi:hypothetical protein